MYYLLEQEMVVDELLLLLGSHLVECVELTGKLTFESVAGTDDRSHNIVSLCICDPGTKREVSKIATNSDASGFDQSSLFGCERRALQG